jgi:ribosomal protein L21E
MINARTKQTLSNIENDLSWITNVEDVMEFANEVSKLANKQIANLNAYEITKFNVGDEVTIKNKNLKGIIQKLNKKTIQVLVKDNDVYKSWIVAPTYLTKENDLC